MRTAFAAESLSCASSGLSPSIDVTWQVGVDQSEELPCRKVGVVDVEVARMGEAREAGGKGRPGLAGAVLPPAGEELRIALAFVLDQPAQKFAVAAAHAVGVEPEGEGCKVGLEVVRMIREGGKGREEAGIGALGQRPDDRDKQILLVAMVIVHGLPGDACLGGDHVDVGSGKPFAAEDVSGSFKDRNPLRGMAAGRASVRSVGRFHQEYIYRWLTN